MADCYHTNGSVSYTDGYGLTYCILVEDLCNMKTICCLNILKSNANNVKILYETVLG
jgi:hypothetical protein